MTFVKRIIKRLLIAGQHRAYGKAVSQNKLSYEDWIEKQEKKIVIREQITTKDKKYLTDEMGETGNEGKNRIDAGKASHQKLHCRKFAVSDEAGRKKKLTFQVFDCGGYRKREWEKLPESLDHDTDAVLFLSARGELSALCLPLLYREFLEDENIVLIYGDEDVKRNSGREKPWFKPDWAPDTFLSCFYFGSLAAVRAKSLGEILKRKGTEISSLYELCFLVIGAQGGFQKNTDSGSTPVLHIPEILFHGEKEGYEIVRNCPLPGKDTVKKTKGQETLISIIIPSRDNPRVLGHCLQSLFDRTMEGPPFEILIVDNGSSDENRSRVEELVKEENRREKEKRRDFRKIRYYYRSMEFNFSRMCNMGAEKAEGGLLLFLNDDMEIVQEDWLLLLSCKALLPRAGAVGAKLLYPNSSMIQHAGITNLRVGPAHKLQFLSDKQDHYYGKNRGVHNMLAVTGACLMVRKEVFAQAGGFFEGLAVAFNDVDLCYTIFENGYYNMVRNDVILYHHESLSRGKDGESEEKQQRLLGEKDLLYERHQDIYGRDPFYHKYLTTDMLESEYSPAFRYQVRLDMPWSQVRERETLPRGVRQDSCVVIGMECAMDIYKWKYGVEAGRGREKPSDSDRGYYFQGYSFVIGADNACYRRMLILQDKESGRIIEIPVEDQYRRDIHDNLKDQTNTELTGFAAKVRLSDIPEGRYRFGMLVRDRCSRQKLIGFSSWVLQAGEAIRQTEEKF